MDPYQIPPIALNLSYYFSCFADEINREIDVIVKVFES